MKKISTIAILSTVAVSANAANQEAKNWTGTGELGYTATSTFSKTSSDSLLAKLGIKYKKERWGNLFDLEAIKTETKDAAGKKSTAADRVKLNNKVTYDVAEQWYALVNISHEDDKLSGLEYTRTYTAGFGWHAIKSDATTLDFELGAGTAESKVRGSDEKTSKSAGRFFEKFSHQINEPTKLTQSYLAESTEDNTLSTFDIALEVLMSKALTLKVSQQIKHNSEQPTGAEPYERTSNVTVVYGF